MMEGGAERACVWLEPQQSCVTIHGRSVSFPPPLSSLPQLLIPLPPISTSSTCTVCLSISLHPFLHLCISISSTHLHFNFVPHPTLIKRKIEKECMVYNLLPLFTKGRYCRRKERNTFIKHSNNKSTYKVYVFYIYNPLTEQEILYSTRQFY